jgi:putative heme-binding domain-containing protein
MTPRLLLAVSLTALSLHAADTRLVRDTEALTPEEERSKLHVPAGFEVQLFAAEPMINKPINIAFDARGRVWVSSNVEYPYSAAKDRWEDDKGTRVRDSRDAIKILEDTNGDGRADKVTVFADGLNIPTGILPWHKPEHKDGCIAWSIPNIWYFADTDGDGKADLREVLFGPLGYEKDTHGMCSSFRLGRDGWVYATHGFNNTSHFKARDGSTLDLHSGNVFRFRPDASHIEIWSWGQVNPFGLTFDRRGNLYSADCHSAPIYQLLRGAYYPSFGKPHDGLGYGPVMCEHTHGSTGICGLAYLDGDVWGPEWNDHTFVGNVVTSRVNHDHITFTGSTPKANEQEDFVVSDDPWFRPVDIQLGPDKALYIADFYNKIIGHYEVPLEHPGRDKERGRIWRIVKKDINAKTARRIEVQDFDQTTSVKVLNAALADPSPFTQRDAAAEWQQRLSHEGLVSLLDLLAKTPTADASLRHVTRMAVREQLKQAGAFQKLAAWSAGKSLSPAMKQELQTITLAVPTAEAASALYATLELGGLGPDFRLTSYAQIARYGDPALLKQGMELAKKHESDLMDKVATLEALHNGLAERGAPANRDLLSWGQELAQALFKAEEANPVQTWTAISTGGESAWTMQARQCADGQQAMVLSSLRSGERGAEQRTGMLRSKVFALPAKLSLWICGHQGFPNAPANNKNLVRLIDVQSETVLHQAFPPRNDTCQRIDWDTGKFQGHKARLEIVDGDDGKAFAWLGVTRIEPAIVSVDDFQRDDVRDKARRTLALLLQHTAPAALREKLTAYLPPRPAPPPLPVSAEQRKQLDALITTRISAFKKTALDPNRGQQIFTTHCAACHQVGGQGGFIGPQLDGIGNRGAERLCEDILDPNRNVDAHFHLHTLKLKDDSVMSGFVKGEAGQVLILADAAGQEHRIPKADLTRDDIIPMSLMPPIFGQTIPEKDFLDLIAWLLRK